MPRPDDYTAAATSAAEAEMNECRRTQGSWATYQRIHDLLFDVPHFREAWHCGTWLYRKLLAAGCCDASARDICFANGQRIAMSADPWEPTMRTLAEVLAGSPPEPGPALAKRLLRGED